MRELNVVNRLIKEQEEIICRIDSKLYRANMRLDDLCKERDMIEELRVRRTNGSAPDCNSVVD